MICDKCNQYIEEDESCEYCEYCKIYHHLFINNQENDDKCECILCHQILDADDAFICQYCKKINCRRCLEKSDKCKYYKQNNEKDLIECFVPKARHHEFSVCGKCYVKHYEYIECNKNI